MKLEYCEFCTQRTMFKRHLGVGTILAIIITWGLWILAIPFYPVRCVKCGQEWKAEHWWQFRWR